MTDPVYDAWRAWRRQCLTEFDRIPPSSLRLLELELHALACMLAEELARRGQVSDRQDARLYRPKGRP